MLTYARLSDTPRAAGSASDTGGLMTGQMLTFYGPGGVELGKTPLRPDEFDPQTGEFAPRINRIRPKESTGYAITNQVSLELNRVDRRTWTGKQLSVN